MRRGSVRLHGVSQTYDCTTDEGREAGVAAAAEAIRRGELVVLPTDTVYGIGADAFVPSAVSAILDAKGRGRDMPPPVLVPNEATVDGLATEVPDYVRRLISRFWPGPLTLVVRSQPSLVWDLGDTNGTVALRMPRDETALDLLLLVGPMAVTSANLTGQPAATSAQDARGQLGDSVAVYLDGGPSRSERGSTILDCTGPSPGVLRLGALDEDELREALGDVELGG